MPGVEADEVFVAARRALLDALDALAPHLESVILIGAQAVYLHTGAIDLPLAETTRDADLAIDPRTLKEDPRVEQALLRARFSQDRADPQPGAWRSPDGMPVDLMVPERFAGPAATGRRGARLPPHAKQAMRRAVGLEAALVDHKGREVAALDPDDGRVREVKVAGPAALVVAKLFKLHERTDEPHRLIAKDAHDVYRLLRAVSTGTLAETIRRLLESDAAADVTGQALVLLQVWFGSPDGRGSALAGEAERMVGDPGQVAQAVSLLAGDLARELDSPIG
jgi:hypothetical protein